MRHYGNERSVRPTSTGSIDAQGFAAHATGSNHDDGERQLSWKGKGRAKEVRLPMDILFLIFVECDVQSLVTCRLVCHQFDTFIKNQKVLLYKLALSFERQLDSPCQLFTSYFDPSTYSPLNGQENPPIPPLTSHQKLQRLRRQGLAWRGDLPPALKLSLPVTRNDSIYELNGGVFALGDVNGVEAGGSWGNMNTLKEGTRLDFVRLPSAIKGDFTPEWGCINVGKGISIVDFTMDLDMDLLVLIEQKSVDAGINNLPSPYRLHILSLSRSTVALEPHPLARFPRLEYPCHPDWWEYQLVFGMYGNHIGLLLGSCQDPALGYDRIVIWDWKKGGIAALHAHNEVFDTFLFLDEGLLLIPNVLTATLDLVSYQLSEADYAPPSPNTTGDSHLGSFTTLMSFQMPALQPGLGYTYILARGQPTGVPEQRNDSPPELPPTALYVTRPSSDSDDDSPQFEQPRRNPFNFRPTPFSPSIDNSIIVVSSRVGDFTNDGHLDDLDMPSDADGTLIVTREMFRIWMIKKKISKEDGSWRAAPEVVEVSPEPLRTNHPHDEYVSTHESESSLSSPIHRSTGVQTTQESSPMTALVRLSNDIPRSSQSIIVPWRDWMRETRWLQDMGSPRWVRDVYGMKIATRVKDTPRPVRAPTPTPTPSTSTHLPQPTHPGNMNALPAMHNLFTNNAPPILAVFPPITSVQMPVVTPVLPVIGSGTPLPSLTAIFAPVTLFAPPGPTSYPLPLPPLPPLSPPAPMPYRTRIFDFNISPDLRIPGTIPYPAHIKLDLTVDSNASDGMESSEMQEIDRRYYGDEGIDQGWSIRNDGPEWTRRPVWEETVIRPGATYAEIIRTGLPYLEITSIQFNDCAALMMDAERIIGMRTDDSGNLTSLEVLVM